MSEQIAPPKIGMVSLGCPKALVDSERILTRLRAEGYAFSTDYEGADAVIVNTCGFLDSAKAESLDAIGEALRENGKVIVTGCLGAEAETISEAHPSVLAITGPQQYEQVMDAVHSVTPPRPNPFTDLLPAPKDGVRLTPRHYAYLKISEGCNHSCRFCIIPDMRGKLVSRPIHAVLQEAERLVDAGVKELLVISQDTSAYGVDLRGDARIAKEWRGQSFDPTMLDLCTGLAELDVWVRLHYVYPYPSVDKVIPLMAERKLLPYLDIPFQHASPKVLKAMRRPADHEKVLERIKSWRDVCPELTVRSTFIVGFPGETEEDFQFLLGWLTEARLNRVGCFKYENVAGAAANDLPDHVSKEVKQDRWERLMAHQQAISASLLAQKVGQRMTVIVDQIDEDGAECRSSADAPEIDGNVFIDENFTDLSVGDMIDVEIDEAGDYDLWAHRIE